MARRTLVTLLIIAGVMLGILMVLNPAGWRARLLARLFSCHNRAVMGTLPAKFQPWVPVGFRVSVFARGFGWLSAGFRRRRKSDLASIVRPRFETNRSPTLIWHGRRSSAGVTCQEQSARDDSTSSCIRMSLI
jgi:hypothetical protein